MEWRDNMARDIRKERGLKTIDVHAHMIALGGPETEEKYKPIMPYLSQDAAGREVLAVRGKAGLFASGISLQTRTANPGNG